MTIDRRTPFGIAPLLLLLATLLTTGQAQEAHAGSGRDVAAAGYFVLAGLQIPAVAFEAVAAVRMNRALVGYTGDATFISRSRSAATGNIVGSTIHGLKFICWTLGGVAVMAEMEFLPLVMVLANGLLDMGNAIVGITLGAMVLGAKRNAGVAGTGAGDAATLSGIVHLVFGSISAIITLPEILVGLFGAIMSAEAPWQDRNLRLALGPGSVSVVGRW